MDYCIEFETIMTIFVVFVCMTWYVCVYVCSQVSKIRDMLLKERCSLSFKIASDPLYFLLKNQTCFSVLTSMSWS